MTDRLLIVGSGFAGMWSALASARAADLVGSPLDIVVIAPEARLGIRPRYYESDLSEVSVPLGDLFAVTGVRFVAGRVEQIDTARNLVTFLADDGARHEIAFDRLVLAAGSNVRRPDIPGLGDHAFDNDQLDHARALQAHLERLVDRPETPGRNTAIVVGGGFTGIETAAELPGRLRSILGADTVVNVVVVERADEIGPDLGPGPRPVIEEALRELNVDVRLGAAVISVRADGVALSDGTTIAADTVIWTAGLEANALTTQIDGERDRLGRLRVTRELRVVGQPAVFATGDVAFAATDDQGNHTLMSCQHAMNLGRAAGHNAAADLLGLPAIPYAQPTYRTCLDLGAWGAVLTHGWDRQVLLAGAAAKAVKQHINTQLICPPNANREEAFAAADPARMVNA